MSDNTPPLNTVPAVGTTPHYCVQTKAARRRQMSDNTPPLNTVPAVGTTPQVNATVSFFFLTKNRSRIFIFGETGLRSG